MPELSSTARARLSPQYYEKIRWRGLTLCKFGFYAWCAGIVSIAFWVGALGLAIGPILFTLGGAIALYGAWMDAVVHPAESPAEAYDLNHARRMLWPLAVAPVIFGSPLLLLAPPWREIAIAAGSLLYANLVFVIQSVVTVSIADRAPAYGRRRVVFECWGIAFVADSVAIGSGSLFLGNPSALALLVPAGLLIGPFTYAVLCERVARVALDEILERRRMETPPRFEGL